VQGAGGGGVIPLLSLALLVAQPAEQPNCESPQTKRDIEICRYLKRNEELEVKTVDEIGFGTNDEMFSLRPAARKCKLMNHVDPIDAERSFFRIINATEESKKCLLKWIRMNTPNLEWTEQKEKELEGFVQ
jgi:hypothetical protein